MHRKFRMLQSVILNYSVCHYTAVFYIVVKLLDLDPQGLWFDPGVATVRSAQLLGH